MKFKMDNLDNTKLLLAAISDYEPYTKSQRKLLGALVELAVNDIVNMSVISLSKMVNTSRFAVYKNLDFLEADNVIEKLNNDKKGRLASFKLNYNKLRLIEAAYLQKQKYLKNNPKTD